MSINKNVWIFQGNPNQYRVKDALSDGMLKTWRVTKFKNDIKHGDIALIWICGKSAGIYAVADITSDPAYMPLLPEEERHYINKDKAKGGIVVGLKFIRYFLVNPLYRYNLRNIQGLENLSIIKCAMGTNFPVIKREWEIIKYKLEEWSRNERN